MKVNTIIHLKKTSFTGQSIHLYNFLRFDCMTLSLLLLQYLTDALLWSTAPKLSRWYSEVTYLNLNKKYKWCNPEKAHYENTLIQIYRKVRLQKLKIFRQETDLFHISAQNIDCGYLLEPPRRGGSNEYPQSMGFLAEIRKMYTPINPRFTI